MKKIMIIFIATLFLSNYVFAQEPTNAKDLTRKLEKMNLKEGENKIEKISGSLSIYAKAEKGVITSYYVKDKKTGKEYNTESSGAAPAGTIARMRQPGGLRFCRVRYVIDGRIVDFLVVCGGQVILRKNF